MTPTRHPEEPVDLAHPLRVAAGQVVVDRDDVDALALERVQVGRQRGHERLALARLHLRDGAAVEDHAADELHVEVPHVQHAAARLAHDGEGLGQQVVERGAVGDARAELGRLRAELLVGEHLDRRLERVDLLDERSNCFQLALVLRAEDLGEESAEHVMVRLSGPG